MCKPCIYTQWRRSLSWLAGLFSTRPLSSAATISQKPYLATVDKPRWMKRNDMTLPLKSIKGITRNTKRTAHSPWTGLQNKIGKRIKPFTISKIPTKPWPSTTKHTEQRYRYHRSPSSLTTTSPARNKRTANCCSLARAHLPLAMRPFASCKPYSINYTRYTHGGQTREDLLQPQGVLERAGRQQTTSCRSQGL